MSERISEVQMAALNSILTINDLSYQNLASDALGMKTWLVPDRDRLTYEQAITIIHYGNELFK